LYTAVVSTPANPGHNNLDEQKPGDDGQNNEQISLFQALSLPFGERDRAMPVPLRHGEKNCEVTMVPPQARLESRNNGSSTGVK
jgi:hypothetical protein